MSIDIGFASQTPSLPGGGGSVNGLGETFAPDLSTGTGTLAVPIDLPNGPNDCSPKLALRYDSGTGNGPFGLGWTLALPRLVRSTMLGRPRYDDSDTLVLEGSGPLVRTPDGRRRPEVETGEWTIDPEGDGFLATDRAGTRFHLGVTPDSRIPGLGGGTWAWLLSSIEDNVGEITTFTWGEAGAQRYLDRITYGPFEVRFGYEDRPDVLRWGRGGFLLLTEQRCRTIELHLPSDPHSLVRRWTLDYDTAQPSGASVLGAVTLTGFGADGSSLDAPTLRLGYTEPGAPTVRRMAVEDERAAPPGLSGTGRVELVDWTGNGIADVIEFAGDGSARVWPNHGGQWGRPQSAGLVPALAGPASRGALVDVDGDGLADVVRLDRPLAGFQPRRADGFARPVSWTDAPAVPIGSPAARFTDLDGDGLADLMWSNGTALLLAQRTDGANAWTTRPTVVASTPDGPPTDLTDPRVYCADMTGDGTPDLVRVDGRGVSYWPYLGYGVFGERVDMADPPVLPFDADPARVLVVDVDGDGCADVLHLDGGRLTWWPNRTGSGFEAPRVIEHLPTGAMSDVRVADLFGTGAPTICWTVPLASGRSRWFAVDVLGGVRTSLLETIDNGLGRRTTITWSTSAREAERDRRAARPWSTRLPVVLPVVTGVDVTDAVSGPVSSTRHAYHDGRYDGVLREVCGFGAVDTADLGDADIATLHTTRWFHTGLRADGSEPATTAERTRARAIRGRLYRQERTADDGTLFDRFTQQWQVFDGTAGLTVVPRLIASTRSTFEGAATPVSEIVTEQLAFDADGNVVDASERSYERGNPNPTVELRTHTEYATDPSGRFRQRVSRITQQDGAGIVVSDLRTHYDGLPEGQVGAQGLVTARLALAITDAQATAVYGAAQPDFAALGYVRHAGTDGWWVQLGRYERAVVGGVLQGTVTGPRGGVATLRFDPSGCYPVRVEDATGNVVTAEFDLRSYQPTAVVNPSGERTEAHFDALARIVALVEPGDTVAAPTIGYVYDTADSPLVVTASRATGGAPIVDRQVLDGDGRILQKRSRDETGEIADVSTAFGLRGVPVRSYLPYRPAPDYAAPDAGAPHIALRYDALGRVVSTVRADGATATVSYGPGVLAERDALGHVTRRLLDARGHVVRIEQQLGVETVTSTFTFDIKGALVEHVDAVGAATRFTLDLLGRTLRVERPEYTQLAVLDASSNVVESRSGAHSVFREFDVANRPTTVRHDSAASAPVTTFTYHDTGAPAPADAGAHTAGGRLVRVDDEAGTTVFDYDARGRLARKAMTPQGHAQLVIELDHRPDDLVDIVRYPGGVVAQYRYDTAGRLRGLDGVIDAIEYDLAGRRTRTAFSNGTETVEQHDPLTGWRLLATVHGPGGVLRDVGYHHDAAGNVTELTSSSAALAWTYTYDDLQRLVAAHSAGGDYAYTYDHAGNITSTSDVGAFGYGTAAAPTCLTSAGADTFTYDDRGHLATAPWGQHTVDAEGRLRVVARAGGGSDTFVYSYGGSLAARRTAAGDGTVTEVLSPDRLVRVEDGQVVVQFSDGERIVARERAGQRLWLHHDHLGSLVMATDATATPVLTLTYDPFGQVLTRNGTAVLPQGFATGEASDLGLVLLGARWYCPRLGRFISPDPVIGDLDDPAAWNLYAYCRNNPTSYIDPSGRSFWKIFAAVVATIAIIAVAVIVTVCTFGIGTPGAVALTVGGLSVTWGAVFAATMVGIVAGGVIGGIAAARAGGDAGDVFLGVVVGGAVGGWAAFGAAFAGVAVGGALGLTSGTVLCGAVVGGVSGAINGAAMGFAAGFAGGKNRGIGDIMAKVLVGAIVGAALGAALGALSGFTAPKQSLGDAARQALRPDPAAGGAAPSAIPPGAGPTPPAPEINTIGGALNQVGTAAAGRAAGVVLPYAAAATAGITGNIVTQTIVVDLASSATAAFFDDLQEYVRTHNVDLGPFNFIKGSF